MCYFTKEYNCPTFKYHVILSVCFNGLLVLPHSMETTTEISASFCAKILPLGCKMAQIHQILKRENSKIIRFLQQVAKVQHDFNFFHFHIFNIANFGQILLWTVANVATSQDWKETEKKPSSRYICSCLKFMNYSKIVFKLMIIQPIILYIICHC